MRLTKLFVHTLYDVFRKMKLYSKTHLVVIQKMKNKKIRDKKKKFK